MNFRRIKSWQEAESIIPVGGKCFLDPKGERWVKRQALSYPWNKPDGNYSSSNALAALGITPYEATEEAVEISAAEAAARMVDGLPVEAAWGDDDAELVVNQPMWSVEDFNDPRRTFRIPATQPEEDHYVIAVPKGTVVPDTFSIWTVVEKPSNAIKAHVVKQEVKGGG